MGDWFLVTTPAGQLMAFQSVEQAEHTLGVEFWFTSLRDSSSEDGTWRGRVVEPQELIDLILNGSSDRLRMVV
jgi:hypothetical protein